MLLAPVVRGQKGEFRDVIERLQREGFVRARVDGELVELTDPNVRVKLDAKQAHTIEAIVDRLVMDDKVRVRLQDSLQTALRWGEGVMVTLHQLPEGWRQASVPAVEPGILPGGKRVATAVRSKVSESTASATPVPGGRMPPSTAGEDAHRHGEWIETLHSNRMYSPATGKSYEPLTPKHFSFNAPSGACPVCHGLGQKMVFDEGLVVPDPEKSLEQGAVLPWRRGGKRMIVYYKAMLRAIASHYSQSLEQPYKDLPVDFKNILLHGSGATEIEFSFWRAGKASKVKRVFEGVLPNMERLYAESESEFTRNRLKAFMSPQFCDACDGRRLKPEILAVTLGSGSLESNVSGLKSAAPNDVRLQTSDSRLRIPGLSIMDVCSLSVEKSDEFFATLKLTAFQEKIAHDVIKEIRARLGFLKNVGLGYLTLNRESGSLSGGEAQRIRLATQIGAGLVGVLYILDEPSIGLHQRDNDRLLVTLKGLRDLGNTVLVVEHDADTIRQADYILDLGPGAGVRGGELVAAGTLKEVLANEHSLTASYLTGELTVPLPKERKQASKDRGSIEIIGASENNLKNVNVRIPIGLFTCVTGVSGSGKSTLVDDVLRRALMRKFYGSKEKPGAHREIKNYEGLEKIVVIDQTPIGRTPRSNPATYTGMFNAIRDLFARLPAAKIRGYEAGRFSFNVKGGRCEKCQGDGLHQNRDALPAAGLCDVRGVQWPAL